MQVKTERGKLVPVKDGWISCPNCRRNKRLLRISPDTEARRLPVFCRDGKAEVILDIARGQSVERRSP